MKKKDQVNIGRLWYNQMLGSHWIRTQKDICGKFLSKKNKTGKFWRTETCRHVNIVQFYKNTQCENFPFVSFTRSFWLTKDPPLNSYGLPWVISQSTCDLSFVSWENITLNKVKEGGWEGRKAGKQAGLKLPEVTAWQIKNTIYFLNWVNSK